LGFLTQTPLNQLFLAVFPFSLVYYFYGIFSGFFCFIEWLLAATRHFKQMTVEAGLKENRLVTVTATSLVLYPCLQGSNRTTWVELSPGLRVSPVQKQVPSCHLQQMK
jgi:hypothetical protein